MTFSKAFALLCIIVSHVASASTLQSARELTDCDTFKTCYLRNLQTGKEMELTRLNPYKLESNKSNDYSIRCEVNGRDGESDFIKFFYDGKVHDEFGEPRWLDGDSKKGEYVVPVAYLSTCGVKTVRVEGHVWSQLCFVQVFTLVAECDDISSTSPVSSPVTKATLAPLTTAPKTSSVTKPAPVLAKTQAPKVSPVAKPTSAPRLRVTEAPSSMPTLTKATLAPFTTAPNSSSVAKPTSAPVLAKTQAPSAPRLRVTEAPSSMPTSLSATMDETTAPSDMPVAKPVVSPQVQATKAPSTIPSEADLTQDIEETIAPSGEQTVVPLTSAAPIETEDDKLSSSPSSMESTIATRTETPTLSPVSKRKRIEPTDAPAVQATNAPTMTPVKMAPTMSPVKMDLEESTSAPTDSPDFTITPRKPVQPLVPAPMCKDGFKLVSGYCVRLYCKSDFKCPRGSQRIAGRECYNDKKDCMCRQGFVKRLGGRCAQKAGCKFGRNWLGACKDKRTQA